MTAALLLAALLAGPARPQPSPSLWELVRGPWGSTVCARVPWYPESLEYEIKWGLFVVGASSLSVSEVVDFSGRPAFRIVSRANSNRFCDGFYKVRDVNESFVDAGGALRSLGYSKKLREGNFFRDEWVVFDYERARWYSERAGRDGSVSASTGTLPGPVMDVLSSIYFLRPMDLRVGDEVVLDVNERANWPLVVKVVRHERITVPAGTFSTILVEPALRKEGIFIQKGKRLQVWLTDDPAHVPVLMRVEVFFGHVSAYLKRSG
jgi:hypothetical protein